MSAATPSPINLSTLFDDDEMREAFINDAPIATLRVKFAHDFIRGSGIVERIEEWQQADRDNAGKRAGGRPAAVSTQLLLTLFVILARENEPLHISRLANLLDHRLGTKACAVLGIEPTNEPLEKHYHRIWRAAARMFDVFDSLPLPKKKRLTKAQFAEVTAAREQNSELLAIKRQRRDWVMNQLLEATYETLPREYRRWKGNIAVDATPVELHAKGVGKKRIAKMKPTGRLSAEPDAGFYGREGDHRDAEENGSPGKKSLHAFETELLVQTTNDPALPADFPLLVIGIGFHPPGVAPTERALEAFQSVISRGHEPGYAIGDRLYFPNAIAENLQLPLRALGYKLVSDYQTNQLGETEDWEGAILVEGNWYSPGLTAPLINATKVFRDPDHADYGDYELYRKRINARTPFLLKLKQGQDADGYTTWMCPATDRNPTLTCDVKINMGINDPASPTNIGRRKSLMPVINVPQNLSGKSICTNKSSVKFPPTAGAKFFQHLQYGTEKWHAMYSTARNTIEGFNAFVKDTSYEALRSPARRRLRGMTAQFFLATMLVAAANLRKIRNFLKEVKSGASAEKKAKTRARRRQFTAPSPWAVAPKRTKAPPE